jgi:hypothetical protein
MTDKERNRISLRFRKQLDDDLRQATRNLDDSVISDLVRDGLRLILGIQTTKRIQVAEVPIVANEKKTPDVRIQAKPAVYVPQQRRS